MADQVLIALCSSAVIKYMVLYFGHRRRPSNAKLVGKVTGIWFYPVKSLKGTSLKEATFTPEGLKPIKGAVLDRHFLVCNPENGAFLTQRQEPKMVLVSAIIDEEARSLVCKAPGMEDLLVPLEGYRGSPVVNCRVWDDRLQGLHCGEEAEKWFTKYLGRRACLLYSRGLEKRNLNELKTTAKLHPLTEPQDKVAYADLAPYLLTTDASLADLNSKLVRQLPMQNFRPNIVVDASKAFEEDDWDLIYIGDIKFRNIKPCGRCRMTTNDQETGVKDPTQEPLMTLKKYRTKSGYPGEVFFGINLCSTFSGTIATGQPVYATMKAK